MQKKQKNNLGQEVDYMKKSSKYNSFNPSDFAQRILIIIMLAWFVIFLIIPIITIFSQVFTDNTGNWVGLENFKTYFGSKTLSIAIVHSISVSLITALVSTILGLLFAYGITRTNMKFKGFYRYVAMVPLFLPTMVHGMALIYIFGKMGFVTKYGVDIGLYGKTGIILAEIFYTFPQAFLVLIVALQSADNRLYEAASVLGSNPVKTFFKITLPNIKYGLINAFIVCFTLSFTDFGAPQVVGGSYNVLATDIYKQVVGQQNMSMGAVVGVILTIPAFVAFIIDYIMRKKTENRRCKNCGNGDGCHIAVTRKHGKNYSDRRNKCNTAAQTVKSVYQVENVGYRNNPNHGKSVSDVLADVKSCSEKAEISCAYSEKAENESRYQLSEYLDCRFHTVLIVKHSDNHQHETSDRERQHLFKQPENAHCYYERQINCNSAHSRNGFAVHSSAVLRNIHQSENRSCFPAHKGKNKTEHGGTKALQKQFFHLIIRFLSFLSADRKICVKSGQYRKIAPVNGINLTPVRLVSENQTLT